MKQVQMTIPGYSKAEYQLVLLPHEELRARIQSVRKEFAEKYAAASNIISSAYLVLARFTAYQMQESKLLNHFRTTAMAQQPFKVEIKNFGSYPSHSIFLNITTRVAVKELVKDLRSAGRLMKTPGSDPHFLDDPQITIARKLAPWQYEQGWNEYRNRQFTAKFIASSLLLLKKREGTRKLEVVGRFEFQNLPVIMKQAELFADSDWV